MTFGAMIGWLAVYHGADLWTGLLVAALRGTVFGLLHAALTVTLGLSQHVSGLGVTLFASSFSYYRLPPDRAGGRHAADDRAVPADSASRSSPTLPFIGPAFFTQTAPTYLAIVMALLLAYRYLPHAAGPCDPHDR